MQGPAVKLTGIVEEVQQRYFAGHYLSPVMRSHEVQLRAEPTPVRDQSSQMDVDVPAVVNEVMPKEAKVAIQEKDIKDSHSVACGSPPVAREPAQDLAVQTNESGIVYVQDANTSPVGLQDSQHEEQMAAGPLHSSCMKRQRSPDRLLTSPVVIAPDVSPIFGIDGAASENAGNASHSPEAVEKIGNETTIEIYG